MQKLKGNPSLLNKKRFASWQRQKEVWLKNLSDKAALKLEEGLLSSSLIWQWRKNFSADKPICLRDALKKKR